VRVLHTADKVGRFLVGAARTAPADRTYRVLEANGGPALLLLVGGVPDSLLQVDIADGRITSVYIIRNPDKLGHLAAR
jgi:RNA polymerase sigma-70 factor (ECF subfamily)